VSANSSITRTQSATASRRGSVIASSQKCHAYKVKDGTPLLESLSKFPRYQRTYLQRPSPTRDPLVFRVEAASLFDLGTAIV
jgi:hypothetical protein